MTLRIRISIQKKRRRNPLGHQRGESCEQLRSVVAEAAERSWSQESPRGRAVGETGRGRCGGVAAARVRARQLPLQARRRDRRALTRWEGADAIGGAVGAIGGGAVSMVVGDWTEFGSAGKPASCQAVWRRTRGRLVTGRAPGMPDRRAPAHNPSPCAETAFPDFCLGERREERRIEAMN